MLYFSFIYLDSDDNSFEVEVIPPTEDDDDNDYDLGMVQLVKSDAEYPLASEDFSKGKYVFKLFDLKQLLNL